MCVCVCVRKRQTDRQTERQIDRQTDRQTDRDREIKCDECPHMWAFVSAPGSYEMGRNKLSIIIIIIINYYNSPLALTSVQPELLPVSCGRGEDWQAPGSGMERVG